MKPTWVLSETERMVRNGKREEMKTLREKKALAIVRMPDLWTLDDDIRHNMMWKSFITTMNDLVIDAFIASEKVTVDSCKLMRGLPITEEDNVAIDLLNISVAHKNFRLHFRDSITDDDFNKLVRANVNVSLELCESSLFANHDEGRSESQIFMNQLLERRQTRDEVQDVIDKMQTLNISKPEDIAPLIYDVYHPPSSWLGDDQLAKEHFQKHEKLKNFARFDPDAKADPVILLMVCALVLYSTGEVTLKEQGKVSKLQDHYSGLLYKYLKSKLGSKGGKKYCEIINCVTIAREMAAIRALRQNEANLEFPIPADVQN